MSLFYIICTGKYLIDHELDNSFTNLFSTPKPLLKFGGLETLKRLLMSLPVQQCRILVDQEYYLLYQQLCMSIEFPLEQLLCTGKVRQRHWSFYLIQDIDYISALCHDGRSKVKIISGDFLPLALLKETWVDDESKAACVRHSSDPILALELDSSVIGRFPEIWDYVRMRENPSVSEYDMLIEWLDELTALNEFDMEQTVAKDWLSQSVTLKSYRSKFVNELFPSVNTVALSDYITQKVYARVGLVGNPSDGNSKLIPGFHGKTISCVIKNFYATIDLIPNSDKNDSSINYIPHGSSDSMILPTALAGLKWVDKIGYNGTHRLFLATLHVLVNFCHSRGLNLNSQGFSIYAKSNIPRQVGLGGSSAIVIGFLQSMIRFYQLAIPLHYQASLALSAEQDQLHIAAGYQDQVVQVYNGLVYMDFAQSLIKTRGYGDYVLMPPSCLPKMWIAFDKNPKESGFVHSNIQARYQNGDGKVVEAMKAFAKFAEEAHDVLIKNDYSRLAELFRLNYECRRELYGDETLGRSTLRMVEIANAYGHAAKLCGSGGCVVGMPFDQNTIGEKDLQLKMEKEGFTFVWIEI